jgi:hypothetical protein
MEVGSQPGQIVHETLSWKYPTEMPVDPLKWKYKLAIMKNTFM